MASRTRALGRIAAVLLTLIAAPRRGAATDGAKLTALVVREAYRPEVPVSGTVRRGILTGDLEQRVETPTLTVLQPHGESRHVCITVESRDGRYRGEFDVLLPGQPATDPVAREIVLPTKHGVVWQKLKARELAVDARLETSCAFESKEATLVVTSWSVLPSLTTVTVLVNIADLEGALVVYPLHGSTPERVRCRPVPEGIPAVAYNAECQTETAAHDLTKTILERSDGDIKERPIPLRIAFPREPS